MNNQGSWEQSIVCDLGHQIQAPAASYILTASTNHSVGNSPVFSRYPIHTLCVYYCENYIFEWHWSKRNGIFFVDRHLINFVFKYSYRVNNWNCWDQASVHQMTEKLNIAETFTKQIYVFFVGSKKCIERSKTSIYRVLVLCGRPMMSWRVPCQLKCTVDG